MATPDRKQKEYSKVELYFGNLTIILWISLGATVCGLFNIFAGLGFFALVAFLVFFELGKHGCVTCYYCKTCTIGMGKLPELFFKQKGIANVNHKALRLFPLVYIFLSVVPVVLVVFSVFQEFIIYKIMLLVAILGFSIYSGTIRRKTLLLRQP
jgi:hypothetical protein